MLDTTLKQYLDQAKAAGTTLDDVTGELVRQGWDSKKVMDAQQYFATGNDTSGEALQLTPAPSGMPALNAVPSTAPPATHPLASSHLAASPYPPIAGAGMSSTGSRISTVALPEEDLRRGSPWKLVAAILLGLFVLAFTGSAASAYLLASDRIAVGNKTLENAADFIALNVPFFPKTPKLVLAKALAADKEVTKASLDFSMVATSNTFASALGTDDVDLQLKGYSDVTDPSNPRFDLTGNITKEFGFAVRKNGPMLYFKITEFPASLLSMIGIPQQTITPLLNQWISYDTTPLETEARKNLDELRADKEEEDDSLTPELEKLLYDEIIPALEMEDESLDGFDTHKITFEPSGELLDRIGTAINKERKSAVYDMETTQLRLSEVVKDLKVTLWIDESEYHFRKMAFSTDLQPQSAPASGVVYPGLSPSAMSFADDAPITLVAVLKMFDFGEDKEIEVPSGAITTDQAYEKLMQSMYLQMSQLQPSPELQFAPDMQFEP